MISFPEYISSEIVLHKIRCGASQTHLSSTANESFYLVAQIPRNVGATEVVINIEGAERAFSWTKVERGFDYYSYCLSEIFKNFDHHFDFFVSVETFKGRLYPDASSHRLVNTSSHFRLTENKNKRNRFIFTFDSPTSFDIKGGVYHIFVDRFNKTDVKLRPDSKYNNDWENGIPEYQRNTGEFLENNTHFGGSFEGIEKKLDYLENLGVDAIYLSPVCKAYSNHKYDVGSYFDIDENFGGKEGLVSLVKKCHDRNIKVILDAVFNHTGDNSVYFNKFNNYSDTGAYQSKNSPYYAWYTFTNYPHEYNSWWGIKCLPAINKGCEDFMNFICGERGVIDFFFSLGIDGLRLDVADELVLEFIKRIKASARRNKNDSIIIGEVWENAVRKIAWNEEKFYFDEGKLDGVTNYPLMNAILECIKNKNVDRLLYTISELYTDYPKTRALRLFNIISTHDTWRAITYLASRVPESKAERAHYRMNKTEYKDGIVKLKLASLLQFTLPGIPCIYYGDEIGMEGFEDPFNRLPMKWHQINKELLNWYTDLLSIRKNNRPLYEGDCEIKYCDNNSLIFDRFFMKERVRVIINLSDKKLCHKLPCEDLIRGEKLQEVTVLPCEGKILRL